MIVNINIRVLHNKAVYVQFTENAKNHEMAFAGWAEFFVWFQPKVMAAPTIV